MLKRGLVAAFMAVTLAGAAYAENLHKIDLGQAPKYFALPAGTTVNIQVDNPTTQVQSFEVPYLGIKEEFAPGASKQYSINTTDLADREFEYTINGKDQYTYGWKPAEPKLASSMNTYSLDSIINYSTAYDATNDPEPTYYSAAPSRQPASAAPVQEEQPMVRGYW